MSHFPFLHNDTLLQSLKLELLVYLAAVTDVDSNIDPLLWWKQHSSEIPNWASALCQVILIQPSLAVAERACSHLNSTFAAAQECALTDYVEVSLMLQLMGTDAYMYVISFILMYYVSFINS